MNEEVVTLVREKMKASKKELMPLIEQMTDIIIKAYETGFWVGFNIGLSVEKKED